MSKRALTLGSNGWETVSERTDIIARTLTELGQSYGDLKTNFFEFYANTNSVEVSVNGLPSFTLLAGDEYTESEDYIESFEVITPEAEYRYTLKF